MQLTAGRHHEDDDRGKGDKRRERGQRQTAHHVAALRDAESAHGEAQDAGVGAVHVSKLLQ